MKTNKFIPFILSLSLILSACGNSQKPAENIDENKTETTQVDKNGTKDDSSKDSKDTSADLKDSAEGTAKGYKGDITATVKFDGDKISSIDLVHNETEGLGDKAAESLKNKIIEKQSINLDAVSGATGSSTGLLEAVKLAIENSGRKVADYEKDVEDNLEKTTTEKDVDVVVVGGGGAGFAAAVSAKENGANVILLEKMPQVGGNTLISGGEYAAPENELQKKEGIEDSKELFAEDVKKGGGNPELIDVLADKATEDAYWLRDDVGVKWLDSLMFFGGHSVKRSLIPENHTGNELISKYLKKCEELDIDVITEADVKELLSKDNKIVGVRAETPEGELIVNSKAVVLATGGFGANKDMTYEYDKEIDEHVLSTNAPGATGDGIIMAEKFDADTVDMDQIQLYPICDVETGRLLYVGDTRLVGGALLVNKEGKRFVEELDTRRAISMAIKAQPEHVGYLIWDEKSNEKTGTMKSNPEEAKNLFDRGFLYKADTIEELADHFGINKDALLETVKTFNENSVNDKDPEWNLRMLGWTIDEPPYYMLEAAPAVHHTMGGLVIDKNAEVLDQKGNRIKGLYAAGEVTGGIHGNNRLGSAAMADITVFGRIAGEEAAKYSKENK